MNVQDADLARDAVEIEVEVADLQGHLSVDRAGLIGLIRRTLAREGVRRATISLALMDDIAIREVNRRHLGHDWPTDVISFGLEEPGDDGLAGELAVSAEMALTTAREAGLDPGAELALYVVHGLLHLCGYDDGSAGDAAAIRRREAEVLAAEGLTNTYSLVGPPGPAVAGQEEAGR